MSDPSFVFPERWRDVRGRSFEDGEERARLDAELDREVAQGHVLYGHEHRAVAACTHCDDVLYELGGPRFAVVHLSYPTSGPDRPPWPDTDVLDDWHTVEHFVLDHEDR